ncbi:MAG: hypothetical protein ACE141_15370 [Bryobacteraceae bacterium]
MSGSSNGDFQQPLLEPVTPMVPAAPQATAQPPAVQQMGRAPDPAGAVVDSRSPADDPLGQAAEQVARSLTHGLAAIMKGQERSRDAEAARLETILEQVLAAISRIDARLDSQAEVIRELSDAVNSQQGRWHEYRTAVAKLKTITDVASLPVHLPDNL